MADVANIRVVTTAATTAATAPVSTQKVFLSSSDFDAEKERRKYTTMKWADLPYNVIYKVLHVKEVPFTPRDGGSEKAIGYVAELENISGEQTHVWLTDIIEKELRKVIDLKQTIFIRSLGPKTAAKSGRTYHDFDIVTQ